MPQLPELDAFASRHGLHVTTSQGTDGAEQFFYYGPGLAHRYAYSDVWSPGQPLVLWVMFNPGTGESEGRRRNTLERCKTWSKRWGYGGLLIGNVRTERTKAAADISTTQQEGNATNIDALALLKSLAQEAVVAWGGAVGIRGVPNEVQLLFAGCNCLGTTRSGQPRHPLYVRSDVVKTLWQATSVA